MTHFDVVVLGAGTGGYTAAVRCAQLGKRVAVVEERFWGGVCLNVGCIPSKALLRNAELVELFLAEREKFGISVDGSIRVDYRAAYERSRKVADGRVKGVHYLMRKNGITEVNGHGTFTDAHTIEVAGPDRQVLTFDHAIIDVGASTRLIPGTVVGGRVVTYEEQILADSLPASIIIAGCGAIGVETAYTLRCYGVDVTMIEYEDRIMPLEDVAVSTELARRFRRAGIKVLTSTSVLDMADRGDAAEVIVESGGREEKLTADRAMQSIGFQPKVKGYGLESTGVTLTSRGAISVDARGRSVVEHIFAIGDVTARLMLAHVAEAMGVVAAETIGGVETMELDFRMLPRTTYCQPQIASFGWTEQQAEERSMNFEVSTFPLTANGKAQGLGDARGFVKLLSSKQHGELLGAHMIGPDVTELLPELTLAQRWDLTVHEVARNVHAHPTLSEAVKEAVHGLTGDQINL